MKIYLSIGIIVCCLLIGLGFGENFNKKRKFYIELEMLINNLQSLIKFSNKQLFEIFESMTFKSDLKFIIKDFINFIEYKKDYKESVNNISFLSNEEKNNIISFFNSLGKYNVSTQLTDLENYKNLFNSYLIDSKEKYNKYFPLCIKLGVILGVFISLLII